MCYCSLSSVQIQRGRVFFLYINTTYVKKTVNTEAQRLLLFWVTVKWPHNAARWHISLLKVPAWLSGKIRDLWKKTSPLDRGYYKICIKERVSFWSFEANVRKGPEAAIWGWQRGFTAAFVLILRVDICCISTFWPKIIIIVFRIKSSEVLPKMPMYWIVAIWTEHGHTSGQEDLCDH